MTDPPRGATVGLFECQISEHAETKVRADRHPLKVPLDQIVVQRRSRAPAFLSCSMRRVASSDVVRVHRMLRDRRDFER